MHKTSPSREKIKTDAHQKIIFTQYKIITMLMSIETQ